MQIIYLKPIFVIGLAAFFSNELTKGGAPEDAIVNICTQVRTATRFHPKVGVQLLACRMETPVGKLRSMTGHASMLLPTLMEGT